MVNGLEEAVSLAPVLKGRSFSWTVRVPDPCHSLRASARGESFFVAISSACRDLLKNQPWCGSPNSPPVATVTAQPRRHTTTQRSPILTLPGSVPAGLSPGGRYATQQS